MAVTTYQDALQLTAKAPVYFFDLYAADRETWLGGFQTGPVNGETHDRDPGLMTPSGVAQKFQERDGIMTIGNLDLEVLYLDGTLSNLIQTYYGLINHWIVCYAGDDSMLESEYVPMWTGRIKKVRVNQSGTGWILSCHDETSWLTDPVFRNVSHVTYLSQSMTPSGSQWCYVNDNAGFPLLNGYVVIGDEVIFYYSALETPDRFSLWLHANGPTGRGALCTNRLVSHGVYNQVYELQIFEENPIDLVLQILTTTAEGNNGPYDQGIANMGLGVPYTDIDIVQWEIQRAAYFPNAICRLTVCSRDVLAGTITADRIINEWVLSPVGAYIVIGWNGLLRLQVPHGAEGSPSGPIIDGSVIIGQPDYERRHALMFNTVSYEYNHNPGDGRLTEISGIEQVSAINLYGESDERKFKTQAWHVNQGAAQVFHDHLIRRWNHSLEPPGLIKTKTIFKRADLDIGQQTEIDSEHLPGISGICEPVDRQLNWPDSTIDWDLLYLSERKQLTKVESYSTVLANYEACSYDVNHTVNFSNDGFLLALVASNYALLKFDLTSPIDALARTIVLSMNAWFTRTSDWGVSIQHDFTLEYTCSASQQLLWQYYLYFLIPYDKYFIKCDYWGHNDASTGSAFVPIGNTVYFKWARLYRLLYQDIT